MEAISTDVLVIGGGLAGLSAALEAKTAGRDVLLVCKQLPGRSGNTLVAATNITTLVQGDETGRSLLIQDTIEGGRQIGDRTLIETMARSASEALDFLRSCGVEFHHKNHHLLLRMTPGHRVARTATCVNKNWPVQAKGQALLLPLLSTIQKLGVRTLEWCMVVDLIKEKDRVIGALVLDRAGQMFPIYAGSVILACGGGGRLYLHTNNTRDVTGDGLALAWRGGAQLRDLEFVQFFPAMGMVPLKQVIPTPLFGDGAIFRNRHGEAFLKKYHPDGEKTAGRDVMSRAIYSEISAGKGVEGGVYLDLSRVPERIARTRYPDLWDNFSRRGYDLFRQPVIVGLSAHFLMGGAVINARAETTVAGLYACGEAAAGIHGANRIGGNALLEAVVFGRIAGISAAQAVTDFDRGMASSVEMASEKPDLEELKAINFEITTALWQSAGVVRHGDGLAAGLEVLAALQERFDSSPVARSSRSWWEVKNKLTVGRLILNAALMRRESRGAHFRFDFPEPDNGHWLGVITTTRCAEPEFSFSPVVFAS